MSVPDLTDRPLRDLVSLKGKYEAVVTGGARGLGAAISCRLAEAGASVVIGDIDEVGAKSTAEEIGGRFGVATLGTPLDAARSSSIAATADLAVHQMGGIDIWVNNRGSIRRHRYSRRVTRSGTGYSPRTFEARSSGVAKRHAT